MKRLFLNPVTIAVGSLVLATSEVHAQLGLPSLDQLSREVEKLAEDIEDESIRSTVPLMEENKIAPTIDAVQHESPARLVFRVREVQQFRWTDEEFHTDEAEVAWHAGLTDSLWVFHADGTFTGVLCRKNFDGETFPVIRGGYIRTANEIRLRVTKSRIIGGTSSNTDWDAAFPLTDGTTGRLSWSGAETAGWSVNGWRGGYAFAAGIACRLAFTRE